MLGFELSIENILLPLFDFSVILDWLPLKMQLLARLFFEETTGVNLTGTISITFLRIW